MESQDSILLLYLKKNGLFVECVEYCRRSSMLENRVETGRHVTRLKLNIINWKI